MKIIKEGHEGEKRATCGECGTVFTYHDSETRSYGSGFFGGTAVVCPKCGDTVGISTLDDLIDTLSKFDR